VRRNARSCTWETCLKEEEEEEGTDHKTVKKKGGFVKHTRSDQKKRDIKSKHSSPLQSQHHS
jgi:hypothetical protein